MSSRENRQALRDAVALVSAATRDPAMFTALTRFYGFNEEQARLVRMLAAVASQAEALEDVDGFALYLAGRE